MKNILIKITGLIASGMLVFSCSGKYLEFEQHGVLPEDETYANADDATAQSLIAGVYVFPPCHLDVCFHLAMSTSWLPMICGAI